MIRFVRNLVAVLVALILVLFSIRSTGRAEVGLFPMDWTLSLPAFLLVFLGIFLGVILAWVVPMKGHLARRLRLRQAERKVKRLERQLAELQQFKNEASAEKVRVMDGGPKAAAKSPALAGSDPPERPQLGSEAVAEATANDRPS